MNYLILILATTILFYLLIPGIGAFIVRSRWKEFRRKLVAAATAPIIDFHKSRTSREFASPCVTEYLGIFKFFGTLEAIQDKYEIWLRSSNFTVTVDMKSVKIYLIPAFGSQEEDKNNIYEKNREIIIDEMPQALSWEAFHSLSQQTEVMVCGPLFMEKGKAIFRNTTESSITFLIYDGKQESLLRRSIWAGRHRNEFWNIFTPVSLVAGSFALFIIAYQLYSAPEFADISKFTLVLSLIPIMPLFPPGVVLFFTYRHFWKKARFLRAERDIVKLPFHHFADSNLLNDNLCLYVWSEIPYCCKKIENHEEVVQICHNKNIKIRRASVLNNNLSKSNIYYYFYKPEEKFQDPLIEEIIIDGNPAAIIKKCQQRSQIYEYLSLAIFSLGMIINFFLTYFFIEVISS
ncbi:MAG: hypothetical protein FWC36_08610 [Spirochaetes bacterium]|nr:hypothetical protein [Spirochaetota bacterium]